MVKVINCGSKSFTGSIMKTVDYLNTSIFGSVMTQTSGQPKDWLRSNRDRPDSSVDQIVLFPDGSVVEEQSHKKLQSIFENKYLITQQMLCVLILSRCPVSDYTPRYERFYQIILSEIPAWVAREFFCNFTIGFSSKLTQSKYVRWMTMFASGENRGSPVIHSCRTN